MRIRAMVLGVCALGSVASACAPTLAMPPRLIAAWPPDGATVGIAPQTLELTFNRVLRSDVSAVTVSRADDGAPVAGTISLPSGDAQRVLMRLTEPAEGSYRVHWHVVAARSGAAAEGEQQFSMRAGGVPPPHLSVSPTTAETGDVVEVRGRGYAPGSEVRLAIGDDGPPLVVVKSDYRGTFSTDVRVPNSVAFGEQPVSARDAAGASGVGALQVRWGGWPPLVGYTLGQPGPASGEVTFSISVRNRSDYVLESVRVVLDDPPAATFVGADAGVRRETGRLVWDVALLDRGVAGPVSVIYRVGAPTTAHARIEFRHRRPHGCSGDECLSAFVSDTTSDSAPVAPAP
jgi:methionine-rich copper-binding protein CopC